MGKLNPQNSQLRWIFFIWTSIGKNEKVSKIGFRGNIKNFRTISHPPAFTNVLIMLWYPIAQYSDLSQKFEVSAVFPNKILDYPIRNGLRGGSKIDVEIFNFFYFSPTIRTKTRLRVVVGCSETPPMCPTSLQQNLAILGFVNCIMEVW